jgi:hypothetical protein
MFDFEKKEMTVDRNRTDVKLIPTIPDGDGGIGPEPGSTAIFASNEHSCILQFRCPGCNLLHAIPIGFGVKPPSPPPSWLLRHGNEADITTWTLTPSIQTHCCGWHGYIENGVFVTKLTNELL